MTTKPYSTRVIQPTCDEVQELPPSNQWDALYKLGIECEKVRFKLDWNGVKSYGNLCYVCPECYRALPDVLKGNMHIGICMQCNSQFLCGRESHIKDDFIYVAVLLAPEQYIVEVVEGEG